MRILLITVLLAACAEDMKPGTEERPIGETVTRDCGEAPLAPGWSVAFDSGMATMTVADYSAITNWRDAVAAWRDCVVTHP